MLGETSYQAEIKLIHKECFPRLLGFCQSEGKTGFYSDAIQERNNFMCSHGFSLQNHLMFQNSIICHNEKYVYAY